MTVCTRFLPSLRLRAVFYPFSLVFQDILAIEVPRLRRLAAPASGSQSIGRGASASLAQRIEEYARDIVR